MEFRLLAEREKVHIQPVVGPQKFLQHVSVVNQPVTNKNHADMLTYTFAAPQAVCEPSRSLQATKLHLALHLAECVKEHVYNVSAAAGERSIAVQKQAGTGAFMYTLDEDGTCAILFPRA